MNSSAYKLFYLFLIVALLLTGLLLYRQISSTNKIATEMAEKPLIETVATELPIDPLDPIFGNQGAAITIVEFIDLGSAESRAAHQSIKNFVAINPTEVRLIWKDFPGSTFFSQGELLTHQAAYCVYKQDKNKFWNYIDELVAAGSDHAKEQDLSALAVKLSVNSAAWQNCLKSSEAKSRIELGISLAKYLGLKKSPEIYINNKKVNYLTEINVGDLLKEVIKKY